MPLPTRKKNESVKNFLARSLKEKKMKQEFPDVKQRVAVAYKQSRKNGKKS